jgi:pimeloyl-ACP methyl ester carboxylesterase
MHADVQAGRTLAAAQRFVEFWSGRASWEGLDAERRHGVAARMPAVMGQFSALFDASIEGAHLARLRMPLLLLCGAQTVAVARRIAHRLRAALPQARHETPAAMGHMGPVTHAEAFNRRLVAFLAPIASSSFQPALQGALA